MNTKEKNNDNRDLSYIENNNKQQQQIQIQMKLKGQREMKCKRLN